MTRRTCAAALVAGLLFSVAVPRMQARPAPSPARSATLQKPAKSSERLTQPVDDGIRCLATLCSELGIKATVAELQKLCGARAKRPTLSDLERCARLKGLTASVARVSVSGLQQSRSYGIAWMGRDGHAAFGPGPGTSAWLWQVASKRKRSVPYAEVVGRSQGLVLLCQPKSRLNAVD